MSDAISRRSFSTLTAGVVVGTAANMAAADDKPKTELPKVPIGPTEAPFQRD